jgi:hypothetical protein
MKRNGLARATTRAVVIGIVLVMTVAVTAPAQVVKSVAGDRVQIAVDLAMFAVSAQVFVTESSAVSVTVNPGGLNTIRRMQADSGGSRGYFFGDVGGIGFRKYPFLGDPSRLLAGISAGVDASFGAGHGSYDPGNGLPTSSLTVLGETLAPSVGVSTKLFEWLFLELTAGAGLTVRRVTEATGDYFAGEVGDTAVGLISVGSFKVGVSF